jgi:hypothetical protein
MNRRIIVVPCVLLLLLLLALITVKDRRGHAAPLPTPKGGQKYRSPQDVFDAFKAAARKKDMKAFVACLTPDCGDVIVGQIAMAGMLMKSFQDLDVSGKTREKVRPLLEAMEKHGLTDEALKKTGSIDPKADPKDQAKALKAIGALVKDKAAFMTAAMAAMKKLNAKEGSLEDLAYAELKDVKIDGSKATGKIKTKKGDMEWEEPVGFEKIKGSWLIVMPTPGQKK